MLNEFIKEYLDIQAQEELLKTKKESVRNKIIELMGGDKKFENDDAVVTITQKRGFKYLSEGVLIAKLKESGKTELIEEKVKATELNKIFKDYSTGKINSEWIRPIIYDASLIQETLTESLTVKGKNK